MTEKILSDETESKQEPYPIQEEVKDIHREIEGVHRDIDRNRIEIRNTRLLAYDNESDIRELERDVSKLYAILVVIVVIGVAVHFFESAVALLAGV